MYLKKLKYFLNAIGALHTLYFQLHSLSCVNLKGSVWAEQ